MSPDRITFHYCHMILLLWYITKRESNTLLVLLICIKQRTHNTPAGFWQSTHFERYFEWHFNNKNRSKFCIQKVLFRIFCVVKRACLTTKYHLKCSFCQKNSIFKGISLIKTPFWMVFVLHNAFLTTNNSKSQGHYEWALLIMVGSCAHVKTLVTKTENYWNENPLASNKTSYRRNAVNTVMSMLKRAAC